MKSRDGQKSQGGLNLDSSLSTLLRNLYLHGVEHCVPLIRGESAIFTKDQVVSILERGYGEKKVRDIPELLSSSSGVKEIAGKNLFKDKTSVLTVNEEGYEVLPAGSLALSAPGRTPRGDIPTWWTVPLPLVSLASGKIVFNEKARALLGDVPLDGLLDNLPDEKEFVLELLAGTFLFREIAPLVYLAEDVSSDVASAREISWWAGVGKAFMEKLHREGKSAERSDVAPSSKTDGREECLPCLWEGKVLGYILVRNGQD